MSNQIEELTNLTMMLKLEQKQYAIRPSKASGARLRSLSLKIKKVSDTLRKDALNSTRVSKKAKVEVEQADDADGNEPEGDQEDVLEKPKLNRSQSRRTKK